MEPLDYQDRFHEALQKAFAATSPAARAAYFELASFYREKLGGAFCPHPSAEQLTRLAQAGRQ